MDKSVWRVDFSAATSKKLYLSKLKPKKKIVKQTSTSDRLFSVPELKKKIAQLTKKHDENLIKVNRGELAHATVNRNYTKKLQRYQKLLRSLTQKKGSESEDDVQEARMEDIEAEEEESLKIALEEELEEPADQL